MMYDLKKGWRNPALLFLSTVISGRDWGHSIIYLIAFYPVFMSL
jgi:hypothetical protein